MMELINAVKTADLAAVKELIGSGADVDQQDEQGWTPLSWAAGKGEIEIVKLLVENGANVFKVGRDQRTPYMIALAAGRVDAARYLRRTEDEFPEEKPERLQRPYCKAYYLSDLRQYSAWAESRINWRETNLNSRKDGNAGQEKAFSDDRIVFLHQDLTVTESMWHSENVIFNRISPEWEEFCATSLGFKVPDDLSL